MLGAFADVPSVTFVWHPCSFLPAIGLLAAFLPHADSARHGHSAQAASAISGNAETAATLGAK